MSLVGYKGALVYPKYLARNHVAYLPWALNATVDLNINTFRFRQMQDITPTQFKTILSDISSVGLKAIPVLPLWQFYPDDVAGAKAEAYRWIVEGKLVDDPRILWWNIQNEPQNIDQPTNLNWLIEMLAYVKSLDPNKPVTFSGWHSATNLWQNPLDIPLFIDYVDIVSPHFFTGTKDTYTQYIDRLNLVNTYSKGKPIFLGAWGIDLENETLQAAYYTDALNAIKDSCNKMNLIGSSFWVYVPPYPTELASIVKSDSTYRLAAYVVKEYYGLTPTPSIIPAIIVAGGLALLFLGWKKGWW